MNQINPDDFNKRLNDLEIKIENLILAVDDLRQKIGRDLKSNDVLVDKISAQIVEITEEPKQKLEKSPPPPPPPPLRRDKTDPTPLQLEQRIIKDSKLHSAKVSKPFKFPERMKKGEFWLNRLGVALLLFGVAFLFKYSIDQGWLSPWVRVDIGFILGAIVLFLGYRIYGKRRMFASTLLGTGIGIWYITGFSAYQILELVSHTTAFGFMIFVTASAFFMSLKQNDSILSIIATIGGFGTPFLLYTEGLPGLIIYTSFIIAGGLGIYFFKGWRSVLWISSLCGWIIFFVGIFDTIPGLSNDMSYVKFVSQAGICFAWLGFWLTPFSRELIHIKNPDKWEKTFVGFADHKLTQATKNVLDKHLYLLIISSPFIGLLLSTLVWPDLSSETFGWITLGLSIIYFSVSYFIRKVSEFKTVQYIHILIAISLFNMSIALHLDGNTLLFSIATEALILQLLAKRLNDKVISATANIIHFISLLWMLDRIFLFEYQSESFFDGQTFTDLWVILTYVITAINLKSMSLKKIYGAIAILTLTGLFLQELAGNIRMFIISSEALSVFFLFRVTKENIYGTASHFIFSIAGLLILFPFLEYYVEPQYALNLLSLTNLFSIFTALIVYKIAENKYVKRIYLLSIVLVFLLIIVREFTFNLEFALVTAEAGILLYLTRLNDDKIIRSYSHFLVGILSYWLIYRFLNHSLNSQELVMLNWTTLTNFWFIVMIAFISIYITDKNIKLAYRFIAHLGFLSLLGFELSRLSNGQGWVSISWGIYGISLLLIGLRMNIYRFRIIGLGTLILLVGKLFLVDLANLETIWKVLLFIGFGGIFLLLSYYFKPLWKTSKETIDSGK